MSHWIRRTRQQCTKKSHKSTKKNTNTNAHFLLRWRAWQSSPNEDWFGPHQGPSFVTRLRGWPHFDSVHPQTLQGLGTRPIHIRDGATYRVTEMNLRFGIRWLKRTVLAWGESGVEVTVWSRSFFYLMPCTLEARTVIKTSCLRSSILTLFENRWKAKSQVSSKVEAKQTQTPTQPKPTQQRKTPRKLSETLRFQKIKSSYRSVLLHNDVAIPTNKYPKWLQVGEGGCPASSQLLNSQK